MKILSRLFVILLLSAVVISLASGCELAGGNSILEPSLKEQAEIVRKWADKVSIGDKEADVKKKIGTEPFFTEKIADSDFARELYVAGDSGLKTEYKWNELLIASAQQNKPSLQVGYKDGVVEIINARFFLGNETVDQRDRRSTVFENDPVKVLNRKDFDTKSELYKKFNKLAEEVSRLWGKDKNLSLDRVKKKMGEPALTREVGNKINLVYVEGAPKLNSEEELTNYFDENNRDFILIFIEKESGIQSAEFRHIFSVKKNDPNGQTSETFTRQVIKKETEIKSKQGSPG